MSVISRVIVGNVVTISVESQNGYYTYGVEDTLPAGAVATNINESGSWDSVNNQVKWLFLDTNSRTLSYTVEADPGEYVLGPGIVSFDGVLNFTLGGDDTVTIEGEGTGDIEIPESYIKFPSEGDTFSWELSEGRDVITHPSTFRNLRIGMELIFSSRDGYKEVKTIADISFSSTIITLDSPLGENFDSFDFEVYGAEAFLGISMLNDMNIMMSKIINLSDGVLSGDGVNKGQLDSYLDTFLEDLSNALRYKGVFDASDGDFSALSDGKLGDLYTISVEGVIDDVEYKVGDQIFLIDNVVGAPSTIHISKIKNTEFTGMVFTDDEKTLTKKTIEDSIVDALKNTISNLDVSMLAEGILVGDGDVFDDNYVATDDTVLSGLAIENIITKKLDVRVFLGDMLGNGTKEIFDFQHNLDTIDVFVQIKDKSNGYLVFPSVKIVDKDNISVYFDGDIPKVGDNFSITVLSLV